MSSIIEYIYRFDPNNPASKKVPPDAQVAKHNLERGNRTFSRFMASCRSGVATKEEALHVINCNVTEVGMLRRQSGIPQQSPFAVVVGCSDARVPTEMLFGQGFNDLFVIRVAGNVLGDVCQGSIDFALNALSESVKVIVVLGHSMCGGVSGAVDSYLRPLKFWSKSTSHSLRAILEKIFVAVRDGANAIEEVWGREAKEMPGYREALIETAVCLNAAQTAFDLRHQVELVGRWEVEVLYGVYNLRNHQVCMPFDPCAPLSDENVNLASAPTSPREFSNLALQMAEFVKPLALESGGVPVSFMERCALLDQNAAGQDSAVLVAERQEDNGRPAAT